MLSRNIRFLIAHSTFHWHNSNFNLTNFNQHRYQIKHAMALGSCYSHFLNLNETNCSYVQLSHQTSNSMQHVLVTSPHYQLGQSQPAEVSCQRDQTCKVMLLTYSLSQFNWFQPCSAVTSDVLWLCIDIWLLSSTGLNATSSSCKIQNRWSRMCNGTDKAEFSESTAYSKSWDGFLHCTIICLLMIGGILPHSAHSYAMK